MNNRTFEWVGLLVCMAGAPLVHAQDVRVIGQSAP